MLIICIQDADTSSMERDDRDEPDAVAARGLEGVEVARTALSHVDGEGGRLIVAGHDVEELASRFRFEDVCALLWEGRLPDPGDDAREHLRSALGRARGRAFDEIPRLGSALDAPDAMDALRAAMAHLTAAGGREDMVLVTAATAVFAAAWSRSRARLTPLPPDPTSAHAADYLRMATGSAEQATALEAYLVTVAEHGMNASTFAARVIASTGSDLVSSIVGAIGALKGPLHGGAPGLVLDMLDSIGEPKRAAAWLEGELRAGRRIMGMGHRVYRVRDPRAAVLERTVEALERAGVARSRLRLARATEEAAEQLLTRRHADRPLRADVEFYTAVLLDAVGLPREVFTATFAVGRVAGWCAHFAEQKRAGRLIRPSARYVGALPPGSPSEPSS
jgi:citrate synthase